MLTREKKKEIIDAFAKVFKESPLYIFVDFKGLSVAETQDFKAAVKEKFDTNVKFTVVRNSLLRVAIQTAELNFDEYKDFLVGNTAVYYIVPESDVDPIEALKIIYEFKKKNKMTDKLLVKGGFLEGKRFSAEEAEQLSKLPSKKELLAKLVGSLNAPISNLVFVLSGIIRQMVYVLNAIKEQKEKE